MSVHTWKSIELAERKGAWAGTPEGRVFFDCSKRELIEAALHLAGQVGGTPDDWETSAQRLRDELDALRANGLI